MRIHEIRSFPKASAIVFSLILWMTSSLAVAAHERPRTEKGKHPGEKNNKVAQNLSTTGAAATMPVVIPLFIQDREFSSTLVLVNETILQTFADVQVRDLDGSEIAHQRVQFAPHSQQRVDVGQLLLASGSPATAGSITITPDPARKTMQLAQLTMTFTGSREPNYLDEEISMPSTEGSQILRGVADISDHSPLIAITSLSDTSQKVTVACLGESSSQFSKSVELLARETLLTEACTTRTVHGGDLETALTEEGGEPPRPSRVAGIALASDAMPGSFAAFGLARHGKDEDRYFSTIAFDDPKTIVSSTKIFTGVPVHSANLLPAGRFVPHVSLANFSAKPAHAVVKYSQMIGDSPSTRDAAQLTIPAGSTSELALDLLEGDADLRNSFIVSSDSAPGDLSVKVVAKSESSLREVELLAKDEMDPMNGGSHPWSLENGTESTLLLFNHSAEAQEFSVAIAAGNTVWKKIYRLASMETAAIRIASLVENGEKDDAGTTLPKGVLNGELIWFSPGPGLGKGRLLQSNRNLAMARNFSCGAPVVLCGVAINPTNDPISIGGQATFSSLLNFCTQARGSTCSGSQVNTNPTGITYSWTSSNTSILSIPGAFNLPNVTADGVGVGSADVDGIIRQSSPICSFSVQASVPVTPKILMGGNNISGTTQSAVAGQQIALTGEPAPPSGSTPWTVAGTTVGGFNTAPTNGGSFPADFTQASTTFYWVTAGNPLNVTYTINGKSASATFNVAGPTNPVVLTPLGAVQISPDGQFLEFGDSGSGATPGIKFQASFTPPLGFPGSFFWVQLISKSNYAFTPAGGSCSDVLGLDNTAPFSTQSTTSDSPSVAVFSDDTDIKWDFAAQMFLLWRPGIAKDIPVPLGSVNWQFFAHAVQNTSTKTWSIQTDSTKSAGSFTKGTSYPAWTTTFLNTVPPPCAK